MRLFLGSFLSAANQDFYGAVIADLVGQRPNVLRSIPRLSAHVTYAFCAETCDHGADSCAAAIRAVTTGRGSVDVRLGGLHVVSAGPQPRLIVSDIQSGADALRRLTDDLTQACAAAFPDLDWKPSRDPHVTLVRFGKRATRADRDAVEHTLRTLELSCVDRADHIDRVDVIQSVLTAAGPSYRSLAGVALS